MLRFESVFWATKNSQELSKKLESLGFQVSASHRDPNTKAAYFGPEAIEIFDAKTKPSTLDDTAGIEEFVAQGDGIFGLGLESDHITRDYKRALDKAKTLEKPRKGTESGSKTPLWTGFSLPTTLSPLVKAWVVMNSPEVLHSQSKQELPHAHPNTCFGIEGIHAMSRDPETHILAWGSLIEKQAAGLQWNEIGKTSGKRLQSGEKFFDVLKMQDSSSALAKSAHGREGIFMLTLRVADLEAAKAMAIQAGATPLPCSSRDGYLIGADFTGGPVLRFVRTAWKRYLPVINENYPWGRRTDQYRPLGGANSTTLQEGFTDNWKF